MTTGLIKAGGSIWIDGFTAGNHQIVANDELNVGTLSGSDLRLSTNSVTALTIDGLTQDVDITSNANVGGMFNVVGATTLQSTLDVNGITDLNSNLNVFGPTDLNSTLNVDGAVVIQNTINQTGGGQVSFSGNVDATSGLDVTGQDLTVGGGNFNVDVTNGTVSSGTIVPTANNTYNLGSSTQRWDEIFVNGISSIHLGTDGDEAHITYNHNTDLFGIDFNGDNTPEFTISDAGVLSANEIQASGTIPVGGIIMWSGSVASIPADWALCDGSNGTPDLRGKFVLGAGSVAPGTSGNGTTTNGVLTSSSNGAHSHGPGTGSLAIGGFALTGSISIPIPDVPSFTIVPEIDLGVTTIGPYGFPGFVIPDPTIGLPGPSTTTTDGAHTHTTGVPFYALAYIMRIQ